MHWYKILAVSLLVCLAGCQPTQELLANGADPIAALSSTVESSRYGPKYWSEQMTAASEIWKEALEYCEPAEHANRPNCEIVASAKFVATRNRSRTPFSLKRD